MSSTIESPIPPKSEHVEYLRGAAPERIGPVVCAFLNGSGGTLIIGMGDNGEVIGVADPESSLDRIQRDLGERLSPKSPYSINLSLLQGKPCLIIDVPIGLSGPYVYHDAIYVRKDHANLRATGSDISALISQRYAQPPRWERMPAPGFDLADLDQNEIRKTAREARDRHFYELEDLDDPQRILDRLNLAEGGILLNAAVVLFARDPARQYPQTRVRAVRYAAEPDSLIDTRTFEGHVFALLGQTDSFLRTYLPVASKLPETGLVRTDTPAYPWAAVREALVNAIIHRDYAAYDGGLTVAIHPDRLEFWNAGALPEGLTDEALKRGGVSRPHNPDMAHVFLLRGLIERLGIGARRIAVECAQAGLPDPEWEERAGGVMLTLRLFPPTPPALRPEALTRRQAAFLQQTNPGDRITAQEYHRRFASDVSARQGRTELTRLVQMGLLRLEGKGPATEYVRTGTLNE